MKPICIGCNNLVNPDFLKEIRSSTENVMSKKLCKDCGLPMVFCELPKPEVPKDTGPKPKMFKDKKLSELKVSELRVRARDLRIKRWWELKKDDAIKKIRKALKKDAKA